MEAATNKMADIIADLKKDPVEPPPPAPAPKVDLKVFQQAVSFQFVAQAPKELVVANMDEVWMEREANIPAHIVEKAKKGFRAQTPVSELRKRIVNLMGGHDQFYEPAFLKILGEAFRNGEVKPNIEIFSWASVDHAEQPDGSYHIVGIGYFEPEVVWKAEKPKNFKLMMATPPPDAIDNAVKSYLEGMQSKHKAAAINDDLAISMGFKTLAQLEGTVRKQIEDKHVREREDQSFDAIRNFLFEMVKISPIPDGWRMFKAQEAYSTSSQRFKSEEAFLKAIGGKSRQEVINYYSQQIAATLAEQLVFKSWAKGIVEGDSSLENLHAYTNTVRKHVLNTAIIEEKDGIAGVQVEATDASEG